jgi:hypothetical protein
VSPVPVALADVDTGTDHALLVDIAEMLTVVSQRDFARAAPNGWGVGAIVRVPPSLADVQPGEILITLERQPNAPGALGDHDVRIDGRPAGHVFPSLESDLADLPVTIAHELFELLVDPTCVLSAVGDDGVVRALETGDPVECDWFLYTCASGRQLRCTNWVLPAYFGGAAGPLDHMGLCTHPGEIRPGGYQITFDQAHGWTEQTAGVKRAYRRALAAAGQTRASRRAARHHWRVA